MTLTPTIPRRDQTPDHLDDRWRAAVRERLATVDLRAAPGRETAGSIDGRDLGDLLVTDWVCPSLEGSHGSKAARLDEEALLLLRASAGRQVVETPDQTVVLRPGALLLLSTRTPVRFVVRDRLVKRTVRVPLAALAPYDTGGAIPGCLLLDTTQRPLAGLLDDFLTGMDSHVLRMSPAEVDGTRNTLLVLIAGLIRSSRADVADRDLLPLLRRRLESWILAHLGDGAVRVADLAAAHNVAPRTVHRAFAATGDTVGAVVRAHRLAAARNDLVGTTSSIAAIAHRWGFSDASHFGREFRREFSQSPGDYRQAHGFVS